MSRRAELVRSSFLSDVPFKSQAQRRKFAELLVKGKISPETFEEWNRETGSARLPEYARKKKKKAASRPKRKAKSKPRQNARRKSSRKRG
jgi:hypothetical protein